MKSVATKRQELADWVRSIGAPAVRRLKVVASLYSIPEGRRWSEIPDAEIATLHRMCLGDDAEPDALGPTTHRDESPEGREQIASLDARGF